MDRLADLLACTAQGDRAAFRLLYDATSDKLFGTILTIIFDRAEAEDVLQETYVRIWHKASSYEAARGRPMTWLITIARYRAIDRVRKMPTRIMVEMVEADMICDPAPTADILVFASKDARRLQSLLDGLPPRVSELIRATYFEGFSYEELARRDGVAVGTMKSWVRRGFIKLREELASPVAPTPRPRRFART